MAKMAAVILATLVFGLGVVWALNFKSETGKGHLMSDNCSSCHLNSGKTNPKKVDSKSFSILVSSQEKLCIRCHTNALEASHPSGVVPKKALPKEFPEDWKGDITCSTCHTIHGKKPGLMRTNKRGKLLCLSCHDNAFFDHMADGGQSLLLSGHLSRSQNEDELETIGLDEYSIQCMTCHGELGDNLSVEISSRGVMRHAMGSVNHPALA